VKVLGLVASHRRLGNTEVLVREALRAAEAEGAQTVLLRLTELEIRPCKGCMACLFKGERCAIDDDMPELIRAIEEADGLVVGAPTYILGPPGIVKMATDRLIELMLPSRLKALASRRRASGILAVATDPEGWAPFTLPLLKLLCYACLAPPVDWALVAASGPGEVALDERALEAARRVGRNVVRAIKGEAVEVPRAPNTCPICGGNLVELLEDGTVRCPLCGVRGGLKLVEGRQELIFEPEELGRARWKAENLLRHVEETIMPTRDRWLRLRRAIKEALARLGYGRTKEG